jgi:transcriptional regulator CtsR
MSVLSDSIELFIKEMMEQSNEVALQRNELAQYFACAPSQINYVLATRFTPDRGYIIVSRRGGGGYIRVMRVDMDRDDVLSDLISNRIGAQLSKRDAEGIITRLESQNIINQREATLLLAATGDLGLPAAGLQDRARATAMKNIIMTLISEG